MSDSELDAPACSVRAGLRCMAQFFAVRWIELTACVAVACFFEARWPLLWLWVLLLFLFGKARLAGPICYCKPNTAISNTDITARPTNQ
jgi:hypothetical protein